MSMAERFKASTRALRKGHVATFHEHGNQMRCNTATEEAQGLPHKTPGPRGGNVDWKCSHRTLITVAAAITAVVAMDIW